MNKNSKKVRLLLSTAFAVILAGRIAYAQDAIYYNYTLPATSYIETPAVLKTNSDDYIDHYVLNIGWAGSGINWTAYDTENHPLTYQGWFNSTGKHSLDYKYRGNYLYHSKVCASMRTDMKTWHECDVFGKIYP